MTNQFSHLNSLDVNNDNTTDVVLYELEGAPTIYLAPALEANKPYYNDVLRNSMQKAAALRANKGITADMAKTNREEERERFKKHNIVAGWKGLLSADGKTEVKYSKEAAADFIDAIPDWLFDKLHMEASQPQSFINIEGTVGN